MDTSVRTIVIFCGPPGSGKSTLANIWRVTLPDAVYLSVDHFVERVARFYGLTYKECCTSKILSHGKRRLTKLLRKAIRENQHVVWDQTNLTEELRTQRFNKFPKYIKILVAANPKSLEFLQKRNETRPRGRLPFNLVVKKLAKLYEFPTKDEISKVDHFYDF